jgi:hypothetical protein
LVPDQRHAVDAVPGGVEVLGDPVAPFDLRADLGDGGHRRVHRHPDHHQMTIQPITITSLTSCMNNRCGREA